MRLYVKPQIVRVTGIALAAAFGGLLGVIVMSILSLVYDLGPVGGTDRGPPDVITTPIFSAGVMGGAAIFGLGAYLISRRSSPG